MFERAAALCAALIFGMLPVAWVSAASAITYERTVGAATPLSPFAGGVEMQVLGGTPREFDLADMPPLARDVPARDEDRPRAASVGRRSEPAPPPPPAPVVSGMASNYPGTAGFSGQAVVALPGVMGGRYTGAIQGYATVCADRCVRLPVVDWCQCYWGTGDQRVADISHAAWPLISDQPLSAGIIEVRVILDDPTLAAAWTGS